ncbi:ethanolamine utilization protein EutN [Lachnospiraceae bacterium KH1T2]|nr:ethanolamine utilization protein EutN [Lachnospiraceae bacterium KH1T2]
MVIGKVTGNVVSTKKEDALVGMKLLVCELTEGVDAGKKIVAVDRIGAGNGEYVLISTGSASRLAAQNKDAPIDAAVVGIIDEY